MKKHAILAGAATLLLSLSLTTSAFAEKPAAKPALKRTVSLNYILSGNKITTGGVDFTSKPKYFPALKADLGVTPQVNAALEYAFSNKASMDNLAGVTVKNTIFRIGANYNLKGGAYAGLGLNQYNIDMNVAGVGASIKTSGLAFNAGYKMSAPNNPWTGTIDFGYGISNKAKRNTGNSSKATPIDVDICGSYKFGTGMKANLGYRSITNTLKSTATLPSGKIRDRGLYIGIGYDF